MGRHGIIVCRPSRRRRSDTIQLADSYLLLSGIDRYKGDFEMGIARGHKSHILILSDGLGALNAIESLSCNSHYLAAEILNLIHKIKVHGRRVAFLWIPSHCDKPGNERADRMAKSATSNRQTSTTRLTLQEANYHVHSEIRSKWNEIYTNSSTGQHYIKLIPTIFETNCQKCFQCDIK